MADPLSTDVTLVGSATNPGTTRSDRSAVRPSRDTAIGSLEALKGVETGAELTAQFNLWRRSLVDSTRTRFSVDQLLGMGAQGMVFRIRDRDTGRELALKTLRGERHSGRRLARFVREAQVAAQLEHPGVVPVHDLEVLPDGTVFYLMKEVQGTSLAETLDGRSGREDTRFEQLEILLKVCDTIAFANDRGVVHRDLKPANIMVGSYGEVLVVDWGLAKVLEHGSTVTALPGYANSASASASDVIGGSGSRDGSQSGPHSGVGVGPSEPSDPYQTAHGHAVGTPAYMSPEQARGASHAVDGRSDVYALGVILYEILAGHGPYRSHDATGVLSEAQVAAAIPLLSDSEDQLIPKALVAIVAKAMSRDADQRYASAADLAEDIRRYLAGQATTAYQESPFELIARYLRRHRGPVLAAATVAFVAVIGFASWQGWIALERSERIDVLRTESAKADASGNLQVASERLRLLLELAPDDLEASSLVVDLETRIALARRKAEAAVVLERDRARARELMDEATGLVAAGDVANLELAVEGYTRALGLAVSDVELQEEALVARDSANAQLRDHRQRLVQHRADALVRLAESALDDERWFDAQEAISRARELVSTTPAMTALAERIGRGLDAQVAAERQQNATDLLEGARAALINGDNQAALGDVRASMALVVLPDATETLEQILAALSAEEESARQRARMAEATGLLSSVPRALRAFGPIRARELLEQARGVAAEHPLLADIEQQVILAERAQEVSQADELLAQVGPHLTRAGQMRNTIDALETACEAAEEALQVGYQPEVARGELRSGLAQLERVRSQRDEHIAAALELLHAAVAVAPTYPEARRAMADFFADRVLDAVADEQPQIAATAAVQGARYDLEGRYRDVFEGFGAVTVRGALAVQARPLAERAGAGLVVDDAEDAITLTPGEVTLLTEGSWYVQSVDGQWSRAVDIKRGATHELAVLAAPNLDDGLVWIPPLADGIASFAMTRDEITLGDWLLFLNQSETLAQIDRRDSQRMILAPRLSALANSSYLEREDLRIGLGRYLPRHRASGQDLNPRLPVTGISRSDMAAYIAWRQQRDGIAWRLPTDQEWQLAASGGDSRGYVWGDFPDLGLTASAVSLGDEGRPQPVPVGSFPVDRSVHGVVDLAGSVAEMVDTRYQGLAGVWIYRGGSWADRDARRFTITGRRGIDERAVLPHVGFRLVVSLVHGRPQPAAGE